MPRRRNPDTDSSTPATPTTPDPHAPAPTSTTGSSAAPLPRPPVTPGDAKRAARLEPARPGRRTDHPSETAVTKRLEKLPVEMTPAPLPPSPAAADAERWFEQIPTNPGAPRREHISVKEISRTPPSGTMAPAPPSLRPNLLTVLIVATALAVGMVLGALLFSHRGAAKCPACGPASAPTSAPATK